MGIRTKVILMASVAAIVTGTVGCSALGSDAGDKQPSVNPSQSATALPTGGYDQLPNWDSGKVQAGMAESAREMGLSRLTAPHNYLIEMGYAGVSVLGTRCIVLFIGKGDRTRTVQVLSRYNSSLEVMAKDQGLDGVRSFIDTHRQICDAPPRATTPAR